MVALYADFTGGIDIAIGAGLMMGVRVTENFNSPYFAKSIMDYWRRWHITMGAWFRDYLYIPLGGSRVISKSRLVFNLFIVWCLTGLWHGANWTFIMWGIMYFAFIAFEKVTGLDKFFAKNRLTAIPGHIYTLFFVMMGWVLFRSESVTEAMQYFTHLFTGWGNTETFTEAGFYWRENAIFFIAAAVFSTPIAKWFSTKAEIFKPLQVLYPIGILCLFIITISFVVKGSYNPFIYFNF